MQNASGINPWKGPDYLDIGCQKCGTTSMYRYMTDHPDILPARDKQLHYFDRTHTPSLKDYAENFPYGHPSSGTITGEATPYYIFHPAYALRIPIADTLPHTRLIILMRNPVSRAWSHYRHEVNKGSEQLPFAEALAAEESRLSGEVERLLAEPGYRSYNHVKYSYKARGRYAEQLLPWLQRFPRERFLFLAAEELFNSPHATMARVFDFLGLASHISKKYQSHNFNDFRPEMPKEIGRDLSNYSADHNERLFEIIGERYNWQEAP